MENNQRTPVSAKLNSEYFKMSSHNDNSNVSTQLKQKLSQSSFQTPHLSVFSSTLLSTTTRAQNLLNKFKESIPVVNIQNIIKQKPQLYMDKGLEHNFDELLQKAYSLVVMKKNSQIAEKELDEHLTETVYTLESEIIPEINKSISLKENIQHQKEIIRNLKIDIEQLRHSIMNLEYEIQQRAETVRIEHENFVQRISICQENNLEVKKEIQDHISAHSLTRTQKQQQISKLERQLDEYLNQLTKLQGVYDKTKLGQGDRRRKIENKSKMYIGILNH